MISFFGALTGDGEVRVGLNLARRVPGKALEHAGVVGQEAVDLQAAAGQHPIPWRFDRVDGRGVLVPHDVWWGHTCGRGFVGSKM